MGTTQFPVYTDNETMGITKQQLLDTNPKQKRVYFVDNEGTVYNLFGATDSNILVCAVSFIDGKMIFERMTTLQYDQFGQFIDGCDIVDDGNGVAVIEPSTDHLFISDLGDLHDTRENNWAASPLRTNYKRHNRTIKTCADLKATLRAGSHTSVGGYPLYFITADGGALSFASVRENLSECLDAIKRNDNTGGWKIIGCDTNWEDYALHCAHSGEMIRAAYEPSMCDGYAYVLESPQLQWGTDDETEMMTKSDTVGAVFSYQTEIDGNEYNVFTLADGRLAAQLTTMSN